MLKVFSFWILDLLTLCTSYLFRLYENFLKSLLGIFLGCLLLCCVPRFILVLAPFKYLKRLTKFEFSQSVVVTEVSFQLGKHQSPFRHFLLVMK